MPSNELKSILDSFLAQESMSFFEGASEEQIESFEKENGIKLPLRYKEWLRFSDGGECFLPAGVQLYGVAHKPIIDVEEKDRPNDNYVVIGTLATGDPILFKKDSEEIVIYNHEEERIEEDEKYQDFLKFLRELPAILGIED